MSEETETPSPPLPPPPPPTVAGATPTISERTLGARAVDYLRGEAAAGRVARARLQSLASVLGVAATVGGGSIDAEEYQDGVARQRYNKVLGPKLLLAMGCVKLGD